MNFLETVNKYKMLEHNDRVVLGLSGGADSVCLLYCLLYSDFELEITAVHINHNLRGEESRRDEQFVRNLCEQEGISLRVFSEDIEKFSKNNKVSVEEAGRVVRSKIFLEVMNDVGSEKLALAHNKNDNAETVLHRIFRGTATAGLCGILPVAGHIIRPLIETDRDDIENYLKKLGKTFITDSSNNENIYTRNKIRNVLIPLIKKEFNPSVTDTISGLTNIVRDENRFLDNMAQEAFASCSSEDRLDIARLSSFDICLQRRILRLFLKKYNPSLKDYSSERIENVLSLLNKQSGKTVELPGGILLRSEFGYLSVEKKEDYVDYFYKNKVK